MLSWFDKAHDLGPRSEYKLALLRGAIERGRLGWKLIPDAIATDFWRKYWDLANQYAPELRMPEPTAKPADSTFIQFRPLALPFQITLWHKLTFGNVDLQFAGMGDRLPEMERLYVHRLLPGMRIAQAARSAVIRMKVAKIVMTLPFESSQPIIHDALEAAVILLGWFKGIAEMPS